MYIKSNNNNQLLAMIKMQNEQLLKAHQHIRDLEDQVLRLIKGEKPSDQQDTPVGH